VRQIAAVTGKSEVTAWRAVERWIAEGVRVETLCTGGRPTRTVAVEDVAPRVGLDVDDVLALLGVRLAA